VEDFVLSCRVAEKKVEHALFRALTRYLSQHGFEKLSIFRCHTSERHSEKGSR
jgi:predicted enzyme involved in methoxymalonyl-ACP biosynthesis